MGLRTRRQLVRGQRVRVKIDATYLVPGACKRCYASSGWFADRSADSPPQVIPGSIEKGGPHPTPAGVGSDAMAGLLGG